MVVSTEVVARKYLDVTAGTSISVDIPTFEETDIYVYYGNAGMVAVQGVDYTVALADDFETFTVTPLTSLIGKIDALIAAYPATETNRITVRRTLDYETESTPAGVRYTPFTSKEFDRNAMRDQQLADGLRRSLQFPASEISEDVEAVIVNVGNGQLFRRSDDGRSVVGTDLQVNVSASASTTSFHGRTALNALAAASLDDGTVVRIDELFYKVDSTATGEDSATHDLGVNGLVAFGFYASPKHYGGVGNGVVDDTDAIKKAVGYGTCQIPAGSWRVASPVSYGSNTKVVGAGRSKTIILSEVIGDSLFKPDGEVVFAYIGDMELRGNGLTGASGNGHAVNMIDPTSGGAFSPQQCVLERLEIRNFRGQDIRKTGVATTICAAGVAGYDCLQNTFQNVLVDNCGHGFYMEKTQNCRALECAAIGCDKMGLFVYDSENFISYGCDWLGCGDGTEDPGYPAIGGAFGSCVVLDAYNQNFVLRDSKIKNIDAGTSLFRSIYSDNSVYDANWIRPDAITNVGHKGFYIEYSVGIRITNNTFHPADSGHSQDYEMIEIYTTQNAVTSFTIEGNTFGDVAGQNIAYNIKLNGNSANRALQGRIVGNQFGFYGARAAACIVASDILLSNCSLTDSQIAFNNFYAATNVTRTACISGASFTDQRNVIGPNKFTAFGGTITAEMSGVRKDHYYGSKFHNPPSLADGDRDSTTVTVTGAALGDTVEVAISTTTSGVHVYGFVSAADTVTVVFQNETGGAVDVGSVAVYATVRKNKAPAP